MLSFTLDEADDLLQSKIKASNNTVETCKEDLEFLREQITTMEVNIARTHNWNVKRKRELK